MWNVKEMKMRKMYLFKMLLQMSDGYESKFSCSWLERSVTYRYLS